MSISIPRIIRESASGFSCLTLEDDLMSRRVLQLNAEIDQPQATAIMNQLMYLSHEDPEAPITVHINSPGGSIINGMCIYDIMQAVPNPIHTVCMGIAASMAALIFAVGDKRLMLPHSTVMVHEPFTTNAGGNMFDLQNRAESLQRMRENYCQIMAKSCKRTQDEVFAAMHKETYFTPQEAMDFGLCDGLYTGTQNSKP